MIVRLLTFHFPFLEYLISIHLIALITFSLEIWLCNFCGQMAFMWLVLQILQKVDKKSESWFQIVAGLASGSRLLRRWVGGRWRGREAPVATPPAPGQQMVATIHLPPSIPCPHLTPGSTAFTWATWTAWITSVT